MGKNFIEQKSVCQQKYLLLAVDFLGRRGGLPKFSFEVSFKSSLKMPVAICRHVFVYFAQEKINSFFFKAEKQEFAYYFMVEVNFFLYLCVSGKK